jgi:hypothetical protein
MLEMLYSNDECVLMQHPSFELILKHKDKFLTKNCFNTYCKYAESQIKKAKGLNKKMNMEVQAVERKTPLDFMFITNQTSENLGTMPIQKFLEINGMKQEHCGLVNLTNMPKYYAMYYDEAMQYRGLCAEDGNDIRLSTVPKGMASVGIVHYNADGYSMSCKVYREYQDWLNNRNTERYVDVENHNQKIDGKNIMHCVRLIETAYDIVNTKTLKVRRPNADYLLEIRKGKHDLDAIIAKVETDIEILKDLFDKSDLPETVEIQFVHDLCNEVRNHYKNNQNNQTKL